MSFHNVSLPKCVEIFAIGRPEFASSFVITQSGREIRSLDCQHAKQRYFIKDCRLSNQEFEEFNSFFRSRRGQNFAFRFRDNADCRVDKQFIAVGDGIVQTFQLYKKYEDAIAPYQRLITKLCIDTVELYIDDKQVTAVIVDYERGIIDFNSAPLKNQVIKASFIFDVPVRFSSDYFDYNYSNDGSIEITNLELIEVVP